jgi:dienelactone hydrolase
VIFLPKVRHLLARSTDPEALPEIATPEEWAAKRTEIEQQVLAVLGDPGEIPIPEPVIRVYADNTTSPSYRHLVIGYDVEPDEEVRAHLLIPPPERRQKGAAVLCLHGTSVEAKDTQLGLGGKPGRDYGRLLATAGFITLSPDHVCAGERLVTGYKPYDTKPFYDRHPAWSAVGKAVWDGQRAIDILCAIPEVDAARIGAVGHSLGGHGSFFVAAFDTRVQAAVSSCGLTTWVDNPKRLNWAREGWYSYFPKLRAPFLQNAALPFELHEFAALVAPRAFLNISGMSDPTYGNNETLPEVGLQLSQLYQVLGEPEKFAQFLFGGGHDVPEYGRALTTAWFKRWLVDN